MHERSLEFQSEYDWENEKIKFTTSHKDSQEQVLFKAEYDKHGLETVIDNNGYTTKIGRLIGLEKNIKWQEKITDPEGNVSYRVYLEPRKEIYISAEGNVEVIDFLGIKNIHTFSRKKFTVSSEFSLEAFHKWFRNLSADDIVSEIYTQDDNGNDYIKTCGGLTIVNKLNHFHNRVFTNTDNNLERLAYDAIQRVKTQKKGTEDISYLQNIFEYNQGTTLHKISGSNSPSIQTKNVKNTAGKEILEVEDGQEVRISIDEAGDIQQQTIVADENSQKIRTWHHDGKLIATLTASGLLKLNIYENDLQVCRKHYDVAKSIKDDRPLSDKISEISQLELRVLNERLKKWESKDYHDVYNAKREHSFSVNPCGEVSRTQYNLSGKPYVTSDYDERLKGDASYDYEFLEKYYRADTGAASIYHL